MNTSFKQSTTKTYLPTSKAHQQCNKLLQPPGLGFSFTPMKNFSRLNTNSSLSNSDDKPQQKEFSLPKVNLLFESFDFSAPTTTLQLKPPSTNTELNIQASPFTLPIKKKTNSLSSSTIAPDSRDGDSDSESSCMEGPHRPIRRRTSSKKSYDNLRKSSESAMSQIGGTNAAHVHTHNHTCKHEHRHKKEAAGNETYMKKYKTELCKNFQLKGYCKWGDKCCFAHGRHELRAKKHLNNKYKSKICKHYHRSGYCPYGHRCQYFHIKDTYEEFFVAFTEKFDLKKKELENEDVQEVLKQMTKLTPRLDVFKNICKKEKEAKERKESHSHAPIPCNKHHHHHNHHSHHDHDHDHHHSCHMHHHHCGHNHHHSKDVDCKSQNSATTAAGSIQEAPEEKSILELFRLKEY